MRPRTSLDSGAEVPVLVDPDRGVVPVDALLTADVPSDVLTMIEDGSVRRAGKAADAADASSFVPVGDVRVHRALPPAAQDLGHRSELRRARGRPVRGRAGGAGVVHQGRPHHHRPGRRHPGAAAERAHHRRGRARTGHRPGVPQRVARRTRSTTSSAWQRCSTRRPRTSWSATRASSPARRTSPASSPSGRRWCRWRRCASASADIADVEVSTVRQRRQGAAPTRWRNMRYSPAFLVALPQRGDAALPRRRHLDGHARAPSTCAQATWRSAASPASGCWSTRSWTPRRELRRPTGGRGGRPRPSTRPGRTPSRGASTTPRRARPTASRGRCTPATRPRRRVGRRGP